MFSLIMGCKSSSHKSEKSITKLRRDGRETFVFFPGLRIPGAVEISLHGQRETTNMDKFSAFRTRIREIICKGLNRYSSKKTKKKTTKDGESIISDLRQTLEDYLKLLLSLNKEGAELKDGVQFIWTNQEDEEKETTFASSQYELLSVLCLMAMVGLCQANMLLTPKPPEEGYQPKTSEESQKSAVEVLLRTSGILKYIINSILPELQEDLKNKLPADLKQGVLGGFAAQTLAQAMEIQLGLAIENPRANLQVKHRLACEQLTYWRQASESLKYTHLGGIWGYKHQQFIKWKMTEAKAIAYHYHGLILDEGDEENTHATAVVCLEAAEAFLKESQNLCSDFCKKTPLSRAPLWGPMKSLSQSIPHKALTTARINKDVYRKERAPDRVPFLPEFPLSLQPEEYDLPSPDAS